jgi:hypothetical protein
LEAKFQDIARKI